MCLQTLLAGWDRYHLDDEHVTTRTVFVDTGSISAIDFAITTAEQAQLYETSRAAATDFLTAQQPPNTISLPGDRAGCDDEAVGTAHPAASHSATALMTEETLMATVRTN